MCSGVWANNELGEGIQDPFIEGECFPSPRGNKAHGTRLNFASSLRPESSLVRAGFERSARPRRVRMGRRKVPRDGPVGREQTERLATRRERVSFLWTGARAQSSDDDDVGMTQRSASLYLHTRGASIRTVRVLSTRQIHLDAIVDSQRLAVDDLDGFGPVRSGPFGTSGCR